MIEIYERGTLTREYIKRETFRLQQLAGRLGYTTLNLEPPSGLFVKGVTVDMRGVDNPHDPLTALVKCRVTADWRADAVKTLKRLEELGIDRLAIARSGAPYHKYSVKRIARWRRDEVALIDRSHRFWDSPAWREHGRKLYQTMLGAYRQKTFENLATIDADPEKVIGDKEPQVGTGWAPPVNNRGGMARHFRSKRSLIEKIVERFYDGYDAAILEWPDHDVLWRVGSDEFRGIWGGTRSDASATMWRTLNVIDLESTSREVGNTPDSTFHNKTLDDRAWRDGLRRNLSPETAMQPMQPGALIEVLTTPPVTECDDGEVGSLSLDFGFREPPARLEKQGKRWTLVDPMEQVKFGADAITENGLAVETSDGRYIMLRKSGQPWTEMGYMVMVGQVLDWYLKRLGIVYRFLSVGDDYHLLLTPESAQIVLNALGNWFRTKGLHQTDKGTTTFVLGHQMIWTDKEHVVALVVPRALKSMSSPTQRDDLGTIGSTETGRVMLVREDVQTQIDEFQREYGHLTYFEGTRDEMKELYTSTWEPGSERLTSFGQSEWRKEFIAEEASAE